MMPHLSRITVYPIKSLDGVDVPACQILPSGILENDRRFALVNEEGKIVNGSRCAAIHKVRAVFDLTRERVRLTPAGGEAAEFSLLEDVPRIGDWLSSAIGVRCKLVENAEAGFPDDSDATGPTLISTATLAEIASWFPGIEATEVSRRLRANLELDGLPAMGEDQLVAPTDEPRPFQLGQVPLLGTGVCRRCVVPSRDPLSGEPTTGFQKQFALQREERLPDWSPRDRFDHFYRVAINTKLPAGSTGDILQVGDQLNL